MTMLFGVQRFTQFLRLLTLPLFVLFFRLLGEQHIMDAIVDFC